MSTSPPLRFHKKCLQTDKKIWKPWKAVASLDVVVFTCIPFQSVNQGTPHRRYDQPSTIVTDPRKIQCCFCTKVIVDVLHRSGHLWGRKAICYHAVLQNIILYHNNCRFHTDSMPRFISGPRTALSCRGKKSVTRFRVTSSCAGVRRANRVA